MIHYSFVDIGAASEATAWYIFHFLPLTIFEWIGYPTKLGLVVTTL